MSIERTPTETLPRLEIERDTPQKVSTLRAYIGLAAVAVAAGLYIKDRKAWEAARAAELEAEERLEKARDDPNTTREQWHVLDQDAQAKFATRLDLEDD